MTRLISTTPTRATLLAILAAFALAACDDGNGDDMDSGTTEMDSGSTEEDAGTTEEDAGTTEEDAGTTEEDAGTTEEDSGTATAAPVITRIAWQAVEGCTNGTPSDVAITVTATDADTSADMLTYNGSVTSCTGTIDASESSVNCPNAAPYPGTVTVTDPDGNSDTQTFMFGQCETGEADF